VKPTCPWCLEPLPKGAAPAACPQCGRPLGSDGEPQARLLRFERVEAAQNTGYRQMLAWGSASAAVIALVTPFLHAMAVVIVPLAVAVHLVVVRVLLVREAQRLMRPLRRFLNRWMIRFAFLWIGLPGYGAMTVPLAGVVLGAGTFCLLTTIAHVSTTVGLERERAALVVGKGGAVGPGGAHRRAGGGRRGFGAALRVVGGGDRRPDAGDVMVLDVTGRSTWNP
jgi:hypothetical protein